MPDLLVINPNTSESVTQLLLRHIQAKAAERASVHAVTAPFGAPYIIDEATYAVAGIATLEAWKAWCEAGGPALASGTGAAIIGCFGDPGLFAMREVCTVPVIGLAEASFTVAARQGRFAIVTGGARWQPILERLASATGHAAALAGIRTVAPSGDELAAHPEWANELLAHACRTAAHEFGADVVILGGASLAGMAAALQADVDVPLIDSVLAGAEIALAAMHA